MDRRLYTEHNNKDYISWKKNSYAAVIVVLICTEITFFTKHDENTRSYILTRYKTHSAKTHGVALPSNMALEMEINTVIIWYYWQYHSLGLWRGGGGGSAH